MCAYTCVAYLVICGPAPCTLNSVSTDCYVRRSIAAGARSGGVAYSGAALRRTVGQDPLGRRDDGQIWPVLAHRIADLGRAWAELHHLPRGGHPPQQIQALDRTQPGLPLKPGKAGTMTHDYIRQGRPPCSRRSTCSTAPCSAAAWPGTATRSSSVSSTRSRQRCRPASWSMSSLTTMAPTSTPR